MRSCIYSGRIEHCRYWPAAHKFQYRLYVYAFDLDELSQLGRKLPLFGYNRLRIASIFDRDYLFHEKGSIREKLARCLKMEGITTFPQRVVLITSPRYINYVFNPVSFYYCYADEDNLMCIVVEVNNTYGERHHYVLKDQLAGGDSKSARYRTVKAFHVSPFNKVEGEYEFDFSALGQRLDVRIELIREKNKIFEARLAGNYIELNRRNHFKVLLQNPLIPHLSIPRIYWEAIRLNFFRKLTFNPKPVPVSPKTIASRKPTFYLGFARKIVSRHFDRLSEGLVRMQMPDGEVQIFGRGTGPIGEIEVRDLNFFKRVVSGGEIGFGESYMAGEWTSPDLHNLLGIIIRNRDNLGERGWATALLSDIRESVHHYFKKNEIVASRRNISQHYDLGNAFFKLFLDETMTYSSAFFRSEEESLEQAQKNKYRKIISKAQISSSDHVLEIGCGWGGFALEAARTIGCRVTAVTISEQQHRYAKEKVAQKGMSHLVDIRFEDYRRIASQYDKIVSIEMLEAVGHKYLGDFFKTCDRLLKKNGLIVIQTIVNSDQRYPREYKRSDFIKKHIFPGGQVPSLTVICGAMTRDSNLIVQDIENIGDHYALTLNRWRRAFLDRKPAVLDMGFSPEFIRKWEYYLTLCEAAYTTRALRDLQIVIMRQGSCQPDTLFQDSQHDSS